MPSQNNIYLLRVFILKAAVTGQSSRMSTKRKHSEEPTSNDNLSIDVIPECTKASTSSGFDANAQKLAEFEVENEPNFDALVALSSCRSALVNNPAACRYTLFKNKTSDDPETTKALETVAAYNIEVSFVVYDPLQVSCQ